MDINNLEFGVDKEFTQLINGMLQLSKQRMTDKPDQHYKILQDYFNSNMDPGTLYDAIIQIGYLMKVANSMYEPDKTLQQFVKGINQYGLDKMKGKGNDSLPPK